MASEAPPFWWQEPDWRSIALWPAALAWGRLASALYRWSPPQTVEAPVINVATLAMGASGRTMTAEALARAAFAVGRRPGILLAATSGAPHTVDAHHDLPRHVGDAALQLARTAPAMIASDRLQGARQLLADGCDLIIVADGKVGDRLAADMTVAVVDARRGLGNGKVAPAGPVRAPLTSQLARVEMLLRFDEGDGADRVVRMAARAARPVRDVALRAMPDRDLAGRKVLYFAGVRDPERFARMAQECGAEIVEQRLFADAHSYAEDECDDLLKLAEKHGALPLTTPQDRLRLRQAGLRGKELAQAAATIGSELAFDTPETPAAIIASAQGAWLRRSGI